MEIRQLQEEDVAEATTVLAAAFRDDPVMAYFMEGLTDQQRAREHLFRAVCMIRLLNNQPLIGAYFDEKLVGVLAAMDAQRRPWTQELDALWSETEAKLGPGPVARLNKYDEAEQSQTLPEPHFYVRAIGVAEAVRGRKVGKALLSHLHHLSACDSRSVGVVLDTENPQNVPLYEHLGYRVEGTAKLDHLTVWYMFRPDQPQSSGIM